MGGPQGVPASDLGEGEEAGSIGLLRLRPPAAGNRMTERCPEWFRGKLEFPKRQDGCIAEQERQPWGKVILATCSDRT